MDSGSWSLIGNWRCIKTNQKNKLNWPSESLIIMLVVITQCILYTIHSFGSILLLHSWCDTCLFLVYIKHSETTWSEPSDAVKFHNNIDVFLHRSHKSCASETQAILMPQENRWLLSAICRHTFVSDVQCSNEARDPSENKSDFNQFKLQYSIPVKKHFSLNVA